MLSYVEYDGSRTHDSGAIRGWPHVIVTVDGNKCICSRLAESPHVVLDTLVIKFRLREAGRSSEQMHTDDLDQLGRCGGHTGR